VVAFVLKALAGLLAAQSRNPAAFGLPPAPDRITELQRRRDILTPEFSAMSAAAAATDLAAMNDEQRSVFDRILLATQQAPQASYFHLDAPGGYGKTFVINALIKYLNGTGEIVVATASSGIAALNMPGGQTAHSAFGLSLTPGPDDVCAIAPGSDRAGVLCAAKLIVWDEIKHGKRSPH
jgi:hypothetical protein